jgi:hypothetical protein
MDHSSSVRPDEHSLVRVLECDSIHDPREGGQRNQTISMDPLLEHGIITTSHYRSPENERVPDRLRRNDPTLKELTIRTVDFSTLIMASQEFIDYERQMILQPFDAIATNSSHKILNIKGDVGILLCFIEEKDRSSNESIQPQHVSKRRPHLHVALVVDEFPP